jgi:ankyrin repeat protein
LLAARGNHVEVMRALAAAGADPKLKAQDGSTLLMAAAASGHIDAVKCAFEFDPDMKAVTEGKQTVMHIAVSALPTSTPADVAKVI